MARAWLRAAARDFSSSRYSPVSPSPPPPSLPEELDASRLARFYSLDTSALPASLAAAFRPLSADEETRAWLASCAPGPWPWHCILSAATTAASALLRRCLSARLCDSAPGRRA